MRKLLNPAWIFLINTLPIAVLFFIFYGKFTIIKSLLDAESVNLWKAFGLALGILGVLNCGYGIYLIIQKRKVSFLYGIIALLSYIPFLYLYGNCAEQLIPSSIPRWMVPEDMLLYVGTFLMPTLVYSLLVLVVHFTQDANNHKAWKNFLVAVIIPVVWFLFSQLILPLWKPVDDGYLVHVMIIFIIAGTVIFLFFLIRSVFIIASKRGEIWTKYQIAWKIPISILLPILGLLVNNGVLFNDFGPIGGGIFGDFNSLWFYALAAINGILICLPNTENKLYRLLLFAGRSITFSYTFYFFLVFMPFLPLSILAIAAIGTGFLMLTPIVLFVLHVNELSKDFVFLKQYYSRSLVLALSVAGILAMPSFITADYVGDRNTLHEALDYLYSPDYSKTYSIDKTALKKTLEVVKYQKDNRRDIMTGRRQPYLSSYYNWIVLDNLTLSDSKINTIERIFFGGASFGIRPDFLQDSSVQISSISTKSTFDKSQNAYRSWVDLEITNKSGRGMAEYATTLELPEGTWISDYYLYIQDKKEMGILAEKKSATWVYSNIRNTNRDPGILYYLTGNQVAFKVFPFATDETRKTGIEFLHKEPIHLSIDGNVIELGQGGESPGTGYENGNIAYISTLQKQKLKKVSRKPYFHFIVDVSTTGLRPKAAEGIQKLAEQYPSLASNAEISFVNSYVSTYPFNSDWKPNLQSHEDGGGFYLDRSIRSALYKSFLSKAAAYPVMIVVTDNFPKAVFDKDFSDWSFAFPESNLFYNLREDGVLEPHSLTSKPVEALSDTIPFSYEHPVLEYRFSDNTVAYLPDNNQPSITLKPGTGELPENEMKEKDWTSALLMQGNWASQTIHPETADEEWLNLVKGSFASKVMTPVTSFLVVENEAQKAILKKKQEQVLSSKRALDLSEDPEQMSEPGIIILIVLTGLVLWLRHRRKRRMV